MKDEIKEILQYVIDDIYQCGEYIDQAKKLEKVLDYITNLQQENERLKENLQQEKKNFKEANDYCFELKDYKSSCKKANAELKNWEKLDLDNLLVAIRRTQNILQNGSDSQ